MKAKNIHRVIVLLVVVFVFTQSAWADNDFSACEKELIKEHVYGGLPSSRNIYVRNGYVLCYNPQTRTPNWVAYHIKPDYRNTPQREGVFEKFRDDPNIANEAGDSEYKGLLAKYGYARGHLAPYGVMGGDRDGDGKYAEYHSGDSSNVGDPNDADTIFQGNYMSNIAPQHHTGFNGAPGLWWKLERWIQDDFVKDENKEVWVFAGCIFGPGEHQKVGPNSDIWVPPMFYKIVIWEEPNTDTPIVLAYLFPHQRISHGDVDDFLVSVDVIETMANVDFFSELDDEKENWLEEQDTWTFAKENFDYED
jgi:endonuclease G